MITPVDAENPTNAEIFAAIVEVNSKIEDLQTISLGSWMWDKSTKIVTYLNTDGAPSFKFEVNDSAEVSSRERRADLEV